MPTFRFAFETPCYPTTFWRRVYIAFRVFQLLGEVDSQAADRTAVAGNGAKRPDGD
jgi:hypothetical protein